MHILIWKLCASNTTYKFVTIRESICLKTPAGGHNMIIKYLKKDNPMQCFFDVCILLIIEIS